MMKNKSEFGKSEYIWPGEKIEAPGSAVGEQGNEQSYWSQKKQK